MLSGTKQFKPLWVRLGFPSGGEEGLICSVYGGLSASASSLERSVPFLSLLPLLAAGLADAVEQKASWLHGTRFLICTNSYWADDTTPCLV